MKKYQGIHHKGITFSKVYDTAFESEEIIQKVYQYSQFLGKDFVTIAEIGCGNGSLSIDISIMLEKLKIEHKIYATDIHAQCIENTKENCKIHNIKTIHPTVTSYVDGLDSKKGIDIMFAVLPWGSPEYLLSSNKDLGHSSKDYLPNSFFHKKGSMGAYVELCENLQKNNISTELFIETGCMPEELIKKSLEKFSNNIQLHQSLKYKNYSITQLSV